MVMSMKPRRQLDLEPVLHMIRLMTKRRGMILLLGLLLVLCLGVVALPAVFWAFTKGPNSPVVLAHKAEFENLLVKYEQSQRTANNPPPQIEIQGILEYTDQCSIVYVKSNFDNYQYVTYDYCTLWRQNKQWVVVSVTKHTQGLDVPTGSTSISH